MYCATVDGSGCGCGGACDKPRSLGAYQLVNMPSLPSYGSFYTPSWGGGLMQQSTNGVQTPTGDHWYDGIIRAAGDFLQDLGGDALDYVKRWISNRVGEEAWERAPEATKRAFVQRALQDYAPVSSFLTSPVVLGLGGLALGYLMFRPGRRR